MLRHILVTIHEQLADNQRQPARDRIEAIRSRLLKEPQRFAEQALKHSECPTAINGGLLGSVPRGQLYAGSRPLPLPWTRQASPR
ncbi:MAG: peptidylprolyl isomerase [Candidatus Accumulibacter sp.]|uniref:Peptidylprolyl isomerase n=1 Tax=Candidatus Accumulibacter affinis TaxID=2954384 RepID=A0A935W4U4_9PROT|nr:peptidylprolyl isomerase [Candidatus Accumulibacter affinis]